MVGLRRGWEWAVCNIYTQAAVKEAEGVCSIRREGTELSFGLVGQRILVKDSAYIT